MTNILKMGKSFGISLFFFSFLVITSYMTSAVSLCNPDLPHGCPSEEIVAARADINYSTIYANDTVYWQGYIPTTLPHNILDNLLWSTAGHTIDTNLDMNSNNIYEIDKTYFSGTDFISSDDNDHIDIHSKSIDLHGNLFTIWNITMNADNKMFLFGTQTDAYFLYNGSDVIFNPKRLGDGEFIVEGNVRADKFCLTNGSCFNLTVMNASFADYVPYVGATKDVDIGNNYLLINRTIQFGETSGIARLFRMNHTGGDGFSFEYWYDFEAPNDDWMVFKKADGNDARPDGGIAFMWSNASNYNKTILKLDGYGNANFTDQNIMTIGNITGDQMYANIYCIINGGCFNLTSMNASLDTYVPYTGASRNVVLGQNNFSVDYNTFFVNHNTNRVGVGTLNPLAAFHVYIDDGLGIPSIWAGDTDMLISDTSTALDEASLSLIGGNGSGSSVIHFGDTQDEDVGEIDYDHENNTFYFTTNAIAKQFVLDDTGNGTFLGWLFSKGLKVNGPANITQNLYVYGNITGNQIYGEMKWDPDGTHTNELRPLLPVANVWYNFSNLSSSLSGFNNGFVLSNGNSLTSQVPGTYKFDGAIEYHLRSQQTLTMSLFVNGVRVVNFTTEKTSPISKNIQPTSVKNITPMSTFNSDLLYADGTGLTFNELNGLVPVIEANFTFTNITDNPLLITFSGHYLGSDSHYIEVQVWNYTSNAWVNVRVADKDIPNSGLIPYTQSWKFPDRDQNFRKDFINSGKVIVRIYHPTNGISSHILFVDQLVLQDRNSLDRQSITGLVKINSGDNAYVMMYADYSNAMPVIDRYNVNLVRIGS